MVGSCPKCRESIRVPEGRPSDIVRCPLCNAEYELETVLNSLPPMLELVSQAGNGIDISVATDEGDSLTVADSDSKSSSPTPSRRYRPQKRKQVNMFAEIIKVILGGVVAIPVGILCVWWFAGRAPFGVAEHVSKFAPWIVPEKLRGGDQIDGLNSDDPDSTKKETRKKKAGQSNQVKKRPKQKPTGGGGLMGGASSDQFLFPPPKKKSLDPVEKKTDKSNTPSKQKDATGQSNATKETQKDDGLNQESKSNLKPGENVAPPEKEKSDQAPKTKENDK